MPEDPPANPPMASEPPPAPVFTGTMDYTALEPPPLTQYTQDAPHMHAGGYHDQAGPSQPYQFSQSMPDWGSQDGYMVDWISDFLGVRTTAPAHTTAQEPSLFFQSGQDQSSPV
ncbi:hypothetical protein PIB30_115129, partial [Stylosanthes scabra]|nr:hypothetical protein [Stylosanthes scabra]